MNAVRPCCVIEPSPGDPLVTARVHGALSAVPSNRYLGEYTPVLYTVWREGGAASTGCLGASPLQPARCAGGAVLPRTLCLGKAAQSGVDGVRGG